MQTQPHTPRVSWTNLLGEQGAVQIDKLVVIDEKENDICLFNRGLGICQCHVFARFQLGRKLFDIRLDGEDGRFRKLIGEAIDDLPGRAFPQVVDVRFERQTRGLRSSRR